MSSYFTVRLLAIVTNELRSRTHVRIVSEKIIKNLLNQPKCLKRRPFLKFEKYAFRKRTEPMKRQYKS